MALCSHSAPAGYLTCLKKVKVDSIVVGDGEADLGTALQALKTRFGVENVRTDSGGTLNGRLLLAGWSMKQAPS